jgi:NAD+ kinase
MNTLHKILLITKSGNREAMLLAGKIRQWLVGRGHAARIQENAPQGCCKHPEMPDPDLILILGGDGTLFSVVRSMGEGMVPVVGINLGQVGFLTELSRENWEKPLAEILQGKFTPSRRTLLAFTIIRQGGEIRSGRAVNDLVTCRGTLARLIQMRVWYGEEHIGTLRADGLIVSNSTGATAYTVSAGGPLIHPDLDVFALTPICPFLSGFMPMIVPCSRMIRIVVDPCPAEPYLTVDGQVGIPLRPGDEIRITSSTEQLTLLQPLDISYFSKLKHKGFILED